jgi:arylsulfatase A
MMLYKQLQRHYPKPELFASEIVKRGQWKLLALEGKPVELYDVLADPNELNDVLVQHPELVTSMTEELNSWLAAERITQ